jgi:hypothetical protein
MSADRANQRGWGRTRRGNGRGVGSTAVVEQAAGVGERWRSCLDARAGRERGRGCSAEGANEQGKWASGVRAFKGARACGGGQKTRGHGRVHDGSARAGG